MLYYLLTNTCYGTRLPGDVRGFVGRVREHRPGDSSRAPRVTHNVPGTPCDANIPKLEAVARSLLKGSPVHLMRDHADALVAQFRDTARFRRWDLRAAAVMYNHFHLVVGVPDEVKPAKVLGDFKSWATRALSARFGERASATWWTERGSKEHLPDDAAIEAAIYYVLFQQPNPLLVWPTPTPP